MTRVLYYWVMSAPQFEARVRSAYVREVLPAVVGYGAAVVVATTVVGDRVDSVWDWALILLPVLPALWGVRAIARHLRRVDEYLRQLKLEAMAMGFGAAMITALTLGFMGAAGLATKAAGWIVYFVGMVTAAVALKVLGRNR